MSPLTQHCTSLQGCGRHYILVSTAQLITAPMTSSPPSTPFILSSSLFHKPSPTSEHGCMLFSLHGENFFRPPPKCHIHRNVCPETLFKIMPLLPSPSDLSPKCLFSPILHIFCCRVGLVCFSFFYHYITPLTKS